MGSLVDKENLKNYRPVSNLQFVSKLVERVVDNRLQKHLSSNNLNSNKQFGYKKHHSTETLLLKIVNNLLTSFDNNIPCVVLLLDLSAAFDTVDHKKLLDILYCDLGVVGTAYEWFKSFLTNRTLCVKIGEAFSDEASLPYGVPQGSVLGPPLFNIYIKPLYKHIEPSNFDIDGYADDHQLLKQFIPSLQKYSLTEGIQKCLNFISDWMNEYFLRLNADKTKIIVFAPPSIRKEIKIGGTFLDGKCIRFVDSAKNLGVLLDSELSFGKQITKVVKSCFSIIRKLSSISFYLSQDDLKTLVCAYVFSQIDYCNSLYFGLNSSLFKKLQHVQNCAARLVMKRGTRKPLDDLFFQFHWLKVRERIEYKLLLTVHKCLHEQAPESLSRLLTYGESERLMKLHESKSRTKYGDRAFSHAGPKLWNLVPQHLRDKHVTVVFKKELKSFLMLNGEDFHRSINVH